MHESARSPAAKPGLLRIFSGILFSLTGLGVVLVGALPLLFLLMLLETTEGARRDPLVWAATILVISFVALGTLLIVYAVGRSRAVLNVVIVLAIMWTGLIAAYLVWRAPWNDPRSSRLDSNPPVMFGEEILRTLETSKTIEASILS